MIGLKIDPEHFEMLLQARGITANQLSRLLVVRHYPSPNVLNTWLHDTPVASCWRAAIATAFRVSEDELFDRAGCMYKDAICKHGITEHQLGAISIQETITRAAITNWKRGGGIEPDKLFALAELLDVQPARLLSTQTQEFLRRLVTYVPQPPALSAITVASPITLIGCLLFVVLLNLL